MSSSSLAAARIPTSLQVIQAANNVCRVNLVDIFPGCKSIEVGVGGKPHWVNVQPDVIIVTPTLPQGNPPPQGQGQGQSNTFIQVPRASCTDWHSHHKEKRTTTAAAGGSAATRLPGVPGVPVLGAGGGGGGGAGVGAGNGGAGAGGAGGNGGAGGAGGAGGNGGNGGNGDNGGNGGNGGNGVGAGGNNPGTTPTTCIPALIDASIDLLGLDIDIVAYLNLSGLLNTSGGLGGFLSNLLNGLLGGGSTSTTTTTTTTTVVNQQFTRLCNTSLVNVPGVVPANATSEANCLQQCQNAAVVASVANIVDCLGVTFDGSLNVNNCLFILGQPTALLNLDLSIGSTTSNSVVRQTSILDALRSLISLDINL